MFKDRGAIATLKLCCFFWPEAEVNYHLGANVPDYQKQCTTVSYTPLYESTTLKDLEQISPDQHVKKDQHLISSGRRFN
jgi:hypothetical protein